MSQASLHIALPNDGQNFPGSGAVQMTGTVDAPGPAGLFFKWYSSLSSDPLGTTTNFPASLTIGSHTITFTAKDVLGDTASDLQTVQRAGFAGGPPIAKEPCIIHVFLANIVIKDPPGAALSKASSTLAGEAPVAWDRSEYQAINHLQYRWRFTPSGPPDGRSGADFLPAPGQLKFFAAGSGDPPNTLPQVVYAGPLPDALVAGGYTMTLRVEDTTDNSTGHEVSTSVVVNP